ncbi:FAD-dependent oxidoreductase [Reinekea thalattae]|uniref:CoA-disulfide reductase n=1 Tax=Reinekea thalattae TaxID=2593301 RepID=A0A5C8ZB59_9GAMM|nr:FAD-dependent oxidoreductase [Reinekea thalattae]TXR54126.1 CoA-disulfide reductase [Reinekea thalattae]
MTKKILIVGGVAGGASAAARLRRIDETAQIIMFERDQFISFANCGLPYHIGGEIEDRNALLVQTPESMHARFNIDIRIQSEVVDIDAQAKQVSVHRLDTGERYQESYDELILSPGAKPIMPPIPGIDLASVFSLRNIPDMDRIIHKLDIDAPRSAVVIGGGFIGIEMAEALVHRKVETTLIELSNQVMPPIDAEMAVPLHQEMRRNGTQLILGDALEAITESSDNELTLTLRSGRELKTDMLIMAIGVTPENQLAKTAGLALGQRGGIQVDKQMRTSVEHIWAVGDAIEVAHFVTGSHAQIPLAGPANRQGRIVADNIFGMASEYKDTLGTGICKVFNLAAASTGANEKQLLAEQKPFQKVYLHAADHAGYYPDARQIHLKLLFQPTDGRILGAQAVGEKGVDKRIDVLATAIRAGLTVFDLEEFELCYAPPFGSAKDIINQAGFVASNALRGSHDICQADALPQGDDVQVLDVRSASEISAHGSIEGAINIPLDQLRQNLQRLPKDKTWVTLCAVGLRGYVAQRMLVQHGYSVLNMTGGYTSYLMAQQVGR